MILNKIVETKKVEVLKKKQEIPLRSFIDKIDLTETYFKRNLSKKGISLIAEIKKASPSKGIICENFDYMDIARQYADANVSAISVLTDEKFFQGNIKYLNKISKNITKPLLRKDFIIDEYQIYEAKYYGASAILLIGEILSYKKLMKFIALARELKLEVLVEVHSKEILKKVLDTSVEIIGVNNRNLQTFKVDFRNVLILKDDIPKDKIVVAESGIKTRNDVEMLEKNGVDAILVGETIMKSNDIPYTIKKLLGR